MLFTRLLAWTVLYVGKDIYVVHTTHTQCDIINERSQSDNLVDRVPKNCFSGKIFLKLKISLMMSKEAFINTKVKKLTLITCKNAKSY